MIGMISKRDLIGQEGKYAQDLMSDKTITAMNNARIVDIAKIMLIEKIHCVPIIK
jgi:predicted transcriptional regulator